MGNSQRKLWKEIFWRYNGRYFGVSKPFFSGLHDLICIYRKSPFFPWFKTCSIFFAKAETEIGLAIGYKNGSLYDLDTEYGYGPGQTQWLDNKKEQMQKDI